jgi:hypothetical protein
MLLALLLRHDRCQNLAAPPDEIAQLTRRLVRQRTNLGLGRRDEMGDDNGVDRVRLGPALAKACTCAGLTTTTGSPAAASLAATAVS